MLTETFPDDDVVCCTVPTLLKLISSGRKLYLNKGKIKLVRSGNHISSLRGRGMEFDESRPYQSGDDIRHLDWRVTARTGKAHSKIFREEQERPIFLWVDQRVTMKFATKGKFKSVIAAEIASLLAWSACNHSDRIGGIIFSELNHHELKPKQGKHAMLKLINQLSIHTRELPSAYNAAQAADISRHAIFRLRCLLKPGSLVFLLSDFRNFDEVAVAQLVQLSQHNDVVIIFIYDPLEARLPPDGRYQVSDGQQHMVLNTYNRRYVDSYAEKFVTRQSELENLSRLCRAPLLSCLSTDDPFQVLQKICT